MLSELKKYKVQKILVFHYYKRNDRKIFLYSSIKLIANDLDIDRAFKSKHQNIMTKIKDYADNDWN